MRSAAGADGSWSLEILENLTCMRVLQSASDRTSAQRASRTFCGGVPHAHSSVVHKRSRRPIRREPAFLNFVPLEKICLSSPPGNAANCGKPARIAPVRTDCVA